MTKPSKNFQETRCRSLTKTVSWRACAVLNSFTILTLTPTARPITNAIAMNVTGFFVFYLFERLWNRVGWGREHVDEGGAAVLAEQVQPGSSPL